MLDARFLDDGTELAEMAEHEDRELTSVAVVIIVIHGTGLVALEVLILNLGESDHDGGLSRC